MRGFCFGVVNCLSKGEKALCMAINGVYGCDCEVLYVDTRTHHPEKEKNLKIFIIFLKVFIFLDFFAKIGG